MFAQRPLPQVPQIIINDTPHDEIDEVLSATSYHSQPGTPMATSFFDAVTHQQVDEQLQAAAERHRQQQQHLQRQQQQQIQMAITHQQAQQAAMQQQQEQERQENGEAAVRTVFSQGYGSFGPCQIRIRTSAA